MLVGLHTPRRANDPHKHCICKCDEFQQVSCSYAQSSLPYLRTMRTNFCAIILRETGIQFEYQTSLTLKSGLWPTNLKNMHMGAYFVRYGII